MGDQFYATIAGSAVALLGVLITLRYTLITHEKNLAQERLKRKQEREFTARQMSFIEALEAVTKFTQYFTTLPDRVLPVDGVVPEESTNLSISLAKLHLYTSIETIEKSTELGKLLAGSFTAAIKSKMPSMFLNEEIKVLDIQIQQHEKRNESIQAEIVALLTGQPQNNRIAELYGLMASNYQKIADFHGKKKEKLKEKYLATEACRDVVLRAIPSISTAQYSLLLMARKELEFDIDDGRYKRLIDDQMAKMQPFLKETIESIRHEVSEKINLI